MSFQASIEIILHISHFRNIDFMKQGSYRFRFKLYGFEVVHGSRIYANPYYFKEFEPYKSKDQSPENDPSKYTYTTKAITISFESPALIPVHEVIMFRLTLPCYPRINDQNIFLEYEMLNFSTISVKNEVTKTESFATGYFPIHSGKLKIKKLSSGLQDYFMVLSNEMNFGALECLIFSTILDFRYVYDQENYYYYEKQMVAKDFHGFLKIITNNFNPTILDEFYQSHSQIQRSNFESVKQMLQKILPNSKLLAMQLPEPSYLKKLREKFGETITLKISFQMPSTIVKEFSGHEISKLFLQDCNSISSDIFMMWQEFAECMAKPLLSQIFYNELCEKYFSGIKDRYGESFFRQEHKIKEFSQFITNKIGQHHKDQAKTIRNSKYFKSLEKNGVQTLNVIDCDMFVDPEECPIIFEEIYIKESNDSPFEEEKVPSQFELFNNGPIEGLIHKNQVLTPTYGNPLLDQPFLQKPKHLVILVHGFQGCSLDMRTIKNNIDLFYPDLLTYVSTTNEDNSEQSIWIQAERLAKEIQDVAAEYNLSHSKTFQLSFIAHSMGGLLVRAALPLLEKFSSNMYTFVTLSSPHLGCKNNSSKLVAMGLWAFNKIKKIEALNQLTMEDKQNNNLENTFLYILSQKKGLEWFKNIALCSSFQDTYAPYESARIQTVDKLLGGSKYDNIMKKMAENILGRLKITKLYRFDVDFEIKQKNFDKFIGRAAHIQFIGNQILIRMLLSQLQNLIN